MSILLESIARENTNASELPTINSLHFDDEMLGDDWLQKRVRRWRNISLLLSLILISSWALFAWYWLNLPSAPEALVAKSENSQATAHPSTMAQGESPSLEPQQTEGSSSGSAQATERLTDSRLTNNLPTTASPEKQHYKPQKITSAPVEKASPPAQKTEPVASENTGQQSVTLNESRNKPAGSAGRITPEQLPPELQQSFPHLAINSYVVAEQAEDSFIILDGGFYQIGQVISPHLVLREIGRDELVVEFHEYWVKVPLSR